MDYSCTTSGPLLLVLLRHFVKLVSALSVVFVVRDLGFVVVVLYVSNQLNGLGRCQLAPGQYCGQQDTGLL